MDEARCRKATGQDSNRPCYKFRMRLADYAPSPARLEMAARFGSLDPLAGDARPHRRRSAAIAAERARVATKGWGRETLGASISARALARRAPVGPHHALQPRRANGLRPRPAKPTGAPMIGRVKKHLVFKPLRNRPYLHGETEPCINGRILALGAYFDEPERRARRTSFSASNFTTAAGIVRRRRAAAHRFTPRSTCSKGCWHTNAPAANPLRSPRLASVAKNICSSEACSARCAPEK